MTTTALDPGIAALVESAEPVIRWRALVELAGAAAGDPRVAAARAAIPDGAIVRALVADTPDRHVYSKWTGAHWRLTSLMDLGVPPELVDVKGQVERVLAWIPGRNDPRHARPIAGRSRLCASQEGNVLAVACHFGLADDPRVATVAENLATWQWPDGGWNCDKHVDTTHASVNESFPAVRGLAWFSQRSSDRRLAALARAATDRAAEFLLDHRVAWSHTRPDRPLHPVVVKLHYPPYWHYDVLAGLRVLLESGHLGDPRTADALDLLEARRRPDGLWSADDRHDRSPGSTSLAEVVAWAGRRGAPHEALSLSALRVLGAAGRL